MDKQLNEDALDQFIDLPEDEQKKKDAGAKKVVLDEREGLIERVDKIHVTRDGRQLLREQY